MRFRHASEALALAFLERSGHLLIQHNYRTSWCEIDLITIDEEFILHSVEVKNWRKSLLRHPLEVFSPQRVRKNQKALLYFIEHAKDDPQSVAILKDLDARLDFPQLSLSFDLVWVRDKNYIEYYPGLF